MIWCRILRRRNSFSENAAPLCKIEIERWHEENIRFFKGDFLSFCLCLFLGGLFLDLTRGTLIRFPNAKSIVTLQKAWIHISFSQHIFISLYMLISNPWFRVLLWSIHNNDFVDEMSTSFFFIKRTVSRVQPANVEYEFDDNSLILGQWNERYGKLMPSIDSFQHLFRRDLDWPNSNGEPQCLQARKLWIF